MGRWIVLLLLIWLSLQPSWAATLPFAYVGSDAVNGSAGLHQVSGDGHATAQSVNGQIKSNAVDSDCASCHAKCSAAISAAAHAASVQVSQLFSVDPQKRLVSVPCGMPDRPQWPAPI
jgi:hypothetical protein